jgi:RND superfamily putative drug exporter
MLCLLFASMNSTKGLGPVAAVGIAIGLMVMLTLLPALLAIFGRWIFWPVRPSFGSVDHTATGVWARVGVRIARAPRATWVATSAALIVAALGVLQLNAVGLENKDAFYGTPDSVVGEQVLARHFPAGSGQPVVVIAKADHAAAVKTAMADVEGIDGVARPVVKGDLAYLAGTLSDSPDSQAAIDTIARVRGAIHQVSGAERQNHGRDQDDRRHHRPEQQHQDDEDHEQDQRDDQLVVVAGGLQRVTTRGGVTPGNGLGAASGLSALAFRHWFGFAGADSSLPLFVFVFLVALGIDYNIFLMTRVREESKEFGTRRGALIGLAATGGVITSAGLVLAGTFAVLATLPVVAFAEIGFAVALGVLLDTLIVRSVLVTALNLDVGRHMWWPGNLAKQGDPENLPPLPVEARSRAGGRRQGGHRPISPTG